jgi:putative transcriptional regulator
MAESSLAPALLLSMPQLADPNFSRTVVLLCKQDRHGAFGLVLSRPETTVGRVVVNLDPPFTTERELEVWIGGPVEPQRSWLLVGDELNAADAETAMKVGEGLYLSTSPALLRRVLEADPPERTRLIIGYAGWEAGQLEAELAASAWLMSDVDPELIFNTPADRMWEAAIRRLGADPATLQMSRGVH